MLATGNQNVNPVLVEKRRGPYVESIHRGRAVVVTSHGQVIRAWGDVSNIVIPRSAMKIVAAIPFISSGAAVRWNCSAEEIVLACSSHLGELTHTKALDSWIKRMGLSEKDLKCGVVRPFSSKVSEELYRQGIKPSVFHNNNAGRHVSFLATALHYGESTSSYLDIDHPVQKRVRAAFERIYDFDFSKTAPAFERCGAPNYPLPLLKLAHGMARFGAIKDLNIQDRDAAQVLIQAIKEKPEYLVGTGRISTFLCQITQGRMVVKGGAEGVFVGFIQNSKLGFAVKIDDGDGRVADVALLGILADLQLLNPDEYQKLGSRPRPKLLDNDGHPVGSLVWVG